MWLQCWNGTLQNHRADKHVRFPICLYSLRSSQNKTQTQCKSMMRSLSFTQTSNGLTKTNKPTLSCLHFHFHEIIRGRRMRRFDYWSQSVSENRGGILLPGSMCLYLRKVYKRMIGINILGILMTTCETQHCLTDLRVGALNVDGLQIDVEADYERVASFSAALKLMGCDGQRWSAAHRFQQTQALLLAQQRVDAELTQADCPREGITWGQTRQRDRGGTS